MPTRATNQRRLHWVRHSSQSEGVPTRRSSKSEGGLPTKLSLILREAKRRATYFLTPEGLATATLPTGQSVPLWSEDFHRWLSAILLEQDITYPTPQQYAAALRNLDEHARSHRAVRRVHIRSAEIKPNQYRIDLHSNPGHAIHVNGKDWRVEDTHNTLFRRPLNNLPQPQPCKTATRLETHLQQILKITPDESNTLKTWLIRAMLPGSAPVPMLIFKGKARNKAASILRNLIDPAINPIHAMPYTAKGINELAQHNRVLAFSIFGQPSKGKAAALKELSKGTKVSLWERNKRTEQVIARIQRPIIIATDEALKIDGEMLTLEVNQTLEADPAELFGAMLTAAVEFIHGVIQSIRPEFAESPAPTIPAPPARALHTPAPYG